MRPILSTLGSALWGWWIPGPQISSPQHCSDSGHQVRDLTQSRHQTQMMGSLVSAGPDKEDRGYPQVPRRTLGHEGCTRSYCDSFKPIVTLPFQFLDLSPQNYYLQMEGLTHSRWGSLLLSAMRAHLDFTWQKLPTSPHCKQQVHTCDSRFVLS